MCNKFDSQPAAELAADGGESHGPIRKNGDFWDILGFAHKRPPAHKFPRLPINAGVAVDRMSQ